MLSVLSLFVSNAVVSHLLIHLTHGISYNCFIFNLAPDDAANFVMELSGFLRELG